MNKSLLLLIAACGALSVNACSSNNPANLPPGKYEHSTSSTDENGTTTETSKSTDVQYDSNGRKQAVVKSKTSRDPPGLFNKSTNESDQTYSQ